MTTLPILILLSTIIGASHPDNRTTIGLDIYNRDQALVREIRQVDLEKGFNQIDFHKISTSIYSHTASIQPIVHEKHISMFSLSYLYELFDPEKYLQCCIGNWISLDIDDELVEGVLVYFDDNDLFI
jgi:hypothetical protein